MYRYRHVRSPRRMTGGLQCLLQCRLPETTDLTQRYQSCSAQDLLVGSGRVSLTQLPEVLGDQPVHANGPVPDGLE